MSFQQKKWNLLTDTQIHFTLVGQLKSFGYTGAKKGIWPFNGIQKQNQFMLHLNFEKKLFINKIQYFVIDLP